MTEKNVIRKRVLGGIPYKPAFLKEIRNYYRDKYNLVSKKTAMQDNFLFNITILSPKNFLKRMMMTNLKVMLYTLKAIVLH